MYSMKHSEILPRLAAYHDGQLGHDDGLEVQAHVEQCSECRRMLADWKALDDALIDLSAPEVPKELFERTQVALAGIQTKSAGPRRVYMRWWMAAAAMFVLGFAGTLWWKGRQAGEMQVVVNQTPSEATNLNEPATPAPKSEQPMLADEQASPRADALGADAKKASTATGPVGTGDTGIPQLSDWPARLTDAEFSSLVALRSKLKFRTPQYVAPLEMAEINLMPYFDDAFVAVGYKPLADPLNPGHEAAYSDPVLLTPETAYLVSNLRLEQTSLWARSHEEGPSSETVLKLAEISWRLANLTADRDDVKGAIAAHNLAAAQRPDWARTTAARLTTLKALDKP